MSPVYSNQSSPSQNINQPLPNNQRLSSPQVPNNQLEVTYQPKTGLLNKFKNIFSNNKLNPKYAISILGFLLLTVGVFSGLALTRISQDVRQQASTDLYSDLTVSSAQKNRENFDATAVGQTTDGQCLDNACYCGKQCTTQKDWDDGWYEINSIEKGGNGVGYSNVTPDTPTNLIPPPNSNNQALVDIYFQDPEAYAEAVRQGVENGNLEEQFAQLVADFQPRAKTGVGGVGEGIPEDFNNLNVNSLVYIGGYGWVTPEKAAEFYPDQSCSVNQEGGLCCGNACGSQTTVSLSQWSQLTPTGHGAVYNCIAEDWGCAQRELSDQQNQGKDINVTMQVVDERGRIVEVTTYNSEEELYRDIPFEELPESEQQNRLDRAGSAIAASTLLSIGASTTFADKNEQAEAIIQDLDSLSGNYESMRSELEQIEALFDQVCSDTIGEVLPKCQEAQNKIRSENENLTRLRVNRELVEIYSAQREEQDNRATQISSDLSGEEINALEAQSLYESTCRTPTKVCRDLESQIQNAANQQVSEQVGAVIEITDNLGQSVSEGVDSQAQVVAQIVTQNIDETDSQTPDETIRLYRSQFVNSEISQSEAEDLFDQNCGNTNTLECQIFAEALESNIQETDEDIEEPNETLIGPVPLVNNLLTINDRSEELSRVNNRLNDLTITAEEAENSLNSLCSGINTVLNYRGCNQLEESIELRRAEDFVGITDVREATLAYQNGEITLEEANHVYDNTCGGFLGARAVLNSQCGILKQEIDEELERELDFSSEIENISSTFANIGGYFMDVVSGEATRREPYIHVENLLSGDVTNEEVYRSYLENCEGESSIECQQLLEVLDFVVSGNHPTDDIIDVIVNQLEGEDAIFAICNENGICTYSDGDFQIDFNLEDIRSLDPETFALTRTQREYLYKYGFAVNTRGHIENQNLLNTVNTIYRGEAEFPFSDITNVEDRVRVGIEYENLQRLLSASESIWIIGENEEVLAVLDERIQDLENCEYDDDMSCEIQRRTAEAFIQYRDVRDQIIDLASSAELDLDVRISGTVDDPDTVETISTAMDLMGGTNITTYSPADTLLINSHYAGGVWDGSRVSLGRTDCEAEYHQNSDVNCGYGISVVIHEFSHSIDDVPFREVSQNGQTESYLSDCTDDESCTIRDAFELASAQDGVRFSHDLSREQSSVEQSNDFLLYEQYNTSIVEGFAISSAAYVMAGEQLLEEQPHVYEFFRDYVYNGIEYREESQTNSDGEEVTTIIKIE